MAAAHGSRQSSNRHAALHDFCLCIPYGVVVAAGGLLGMVFGGGLPALAIAAAGALQVVLSNLSMQAWRARRQSLAVTAVEAGENGGNGHTQRCCGRGPIMSILPPYTLRCRSLRNQVPCTTHGFPDAQALRAACPGTAGRRCTLAPAAGPLARCWRSALR